MGEELRESRDKQSGHHSNRFKPINININAGRYLRHRATCTIYGAKKKQVYERTKAPLLTLMAGGSPETVFCILKHLEGMLPRCPGVFDDEYRQFFTRYTSKYVPRTYFGLKLQIKNGHGYPQN